MDRANPLQLESRGVTSHFRTKTALSPSASKQINFWQQSIIHRNTVAAKLREAGMIEPAAKLEDCHTHTTVKVCSDCGTASRFENRCDLFFCPQCAIRLQREREEQVAWWTHEIHQPKHVVLTMKNVPQLRVWHVRRLRDCLAKLRRSKFCRNWNGGFYRFEVTNEGKGWHLHIHLLVDAIWIDAIELSAKWARITKNDGRIVKVKDCRGADYLHEVTKYVVKGNMLASWSPEHIVQFVTAFDGQRTFGVFGSLYGKRTEFAEWIAEIKTDKQHCDCGSTRCKYYSEIEWLVKSLRLVPTSNSPPTRTAEQRPLALPTEPAWPD
jgi:hypothetical protein